MLRTTLAALLLAAVAAVCAQDPQRRGEFSLAGTVTNSVSGEPVKYAIVSLDGRPARSVLADAAGAFRFTDLAEGSYRVRARKPGHAASGESPSVKLGPSREGVVIILSPLGVIHGRVLDEEGGPVPGVLVEALRSKTVNGRRHLEVLRSVTTDDRGEYRMWNFTKGAYLVKAAGRRGMAIYIGERGPAFSARDAFAPTYSGGGHSAAAALVTKIEPGADVRSDLSITMGPARTIRGVISNLAPYHPATIELLSGNEDIGANRVSLNVSTGQFQILDVIDGTYRLRVTQEKAGEDEARTRAEQTVHVAGEDLTGLSLTLAGGVPVRGTVRVEGPPNDLASVRCTISLVPDDEPPRYADHADPLSATVDEQGRFEIPSVVQGRYRLEIEPLSRAFVSSAMAGGEDLLAKPELLVGAATPPPPVEIALNANPGSISGHLRIEGHGTDNPVVVLIPESPGGVPRAYNDDGEDGSFAFLNLAPGMYRLHAWNRDTEPEYANTDVLRVLASSGERVEVSPGRESKVELKRLSEVRQ